jgi:hypothetical protein
LFVKSSKDCILLNSWLICVILTWNQKIHLLAYY